MREHELHQAQSRLLSRQEIRSLRGDCECRSEGVVEAGTPLLHIGDPADLEIVLNFLSEDAVRTKPGQRKLQRSRSSNRALRADPGVGARNRGQRVDVILHFADPTESWRSLGHGYRGRCRGSMRLPPPRQPTDTSLELPAERLWPQSVQRRKGPGVATERIAVDGQPRPTEANQGLECTAPFANHPVADVIKLRTFRLAHPKNAALRDFHLWPAGTCGDFLNRFAIDRST
ncbi:hypothetical protein I7F13_11140 [Sinorhizobium meliloti]|nr:hypothetical protein [Sinorhizobium meliloti]QND30356.1 HlyD family secretion protein [Sinorhizobium meliloti]RVE95398.1 HlyD family secretion protein [Sinorhizobium meliloti]RVG04928.1 HlyD family secretion protein [Sinorhizobium meliloti]RVG54262.1 HlyD family secretion protein [Sinorhizobium meliloti]